MNWDGPHHQEKSTSKGQTQKAPLWSKVGYSTSGIPSLPPIWTVYKRHFPHVKEKLIRKMREWNVPVTLRFKKFLGSQVCHHCSKFTDMPSVSFYTFGKGNHFQAPGAYRKEHLRLPKWLPNHRNISKGMPASKRPDNGGFKNLGFVFNHNKILPTPPPDLCMFRLQWNSKKSCVSTQQSIKFFPRNLGGQSSRKHLQMAAQRNYGIN